MTDTNVDAEQEDDVLTVIVDYVPDKKNKKAVRLLVGQLMDTLAAKDEALAAKDEALAEARAASAAKDDVAKQLRKEVKRAVAEHLRAIHQLHARGVLEQLEVQLGKQYGADRLAFWQTALADAANRGILQALANCAGKQQDAAAAIGSADAGNPRKLDKLSGKLANDIKGVYEWLSDGIHNNPSGKEDKVPVKAGTAYTCKIEAICDAYGVDWEEI